MSMAYQQREELAHLPDEEFLTGPDTQPMDSQLTDDHILYQAAMLCDNKAGLAEHPQTADIISALLDLSKMAARVACEFDWEHGKVDKEGFERAYKDATRFIRATEVEFDRALASVGSDSMIASDGLSPTVSQTAEVPASTITTPGVVEALTMTLLGGIPTSFSDSIWHDTLEDLYSKLSDKLYAGLLESLGQDLLEPVAAALMERVSERVCNAALNSLGNVSLARLAATTHTRRYSASPTASSTARNTSGTEGRVWGGADDPMCVPSGFKRTRFDDDEMDTRRNKHGEGSGGRNIRK